MVSLHFKELKRYRFFFLQRKKTNPTSPLQTDPNLRPSLQLGLLDFGLVAQVPRKDRDIIVSAVVHLGDSGLGQRGVVGLLWLVGFGGWWFGVVWSIDLHIKA